MKTKSSSVWMYAAMVVVVLFMASCHSNKKKEREERRIEQRQMPAGEVIETETVVVEVDSIVPDSSMNRNRRP